MSIAPAFADILTARTRTAGRLRRTPLVRSDWLSRVAGGDVYLKLESLQVTNSFKPRGTLNALLHMAEQRVPDEEPPRLVTASAGNHGRALAWAAEQPPGRPILVFTPRDAPATKLEAIRRHGAELRATAANYDEAEREAKRFAAEHGALYLSPYSHPDMISGFGTIGLEIVEDMGWAPQTTGRGAAGAAASARGGRVVVPVGGGGLLAGIALALEALAPTIEVVGVEVEASHAVTASLAAGRIVEVEVGPTLADGLAGNMDPQNIAFPLVQRLVHEMTTVSEAELAAAIGGLVREEHLIAEGAAATAVAAVLAGRFRHTTSPTILVISGANIDSGRLKPLL